MYHKNEYENNYSNYRDSKQPDNPEPRQMNSQGSRQFYNSGSRQQNVQGQRPGPQQSHYPGSKQQFNNSGSGQLFSTSEPRPLFSINEPRQQFSTSGLEQLFSNSGPKPLSNVGSYRQNNPGSKQFQPSRPQQNFQSQGNGSPFHGSFNNPNAMQSQSQFQTEPWKRRQSSEDNFQQNQRPGPRLFFNVRTDKRKEVPKTYAEPRKTTFPHNSKVSLPKELTSQFQPLYCKLCCIKMTSNVMAKLHYNSKNHEKNIRKFLLEQAEETGEPVHEWVNAKRIKKDNEPYNPKHFFCNVCSIPLTGKLHSQSHYMGRPHQKALSVKSDENKQQVEKNPNVDNKLTVPLFGDPIAQDGSGSDNPFEAFGGEKEKKNPELHCEICCVQATSQQQLDLHLNGVKHQKRISQQKTFLQPAEGSAIGTGLAKVLFVKPEALQSPTTSDELSTYKTPSGLYYCNTCNLSMNSEVQFKQHLGSKKHRKVAAGKSDQGAKPDTK